MLRKKNEAPKASADLSALLGSNLKKTLTTTNVSDSHSNPTFTMPKVLPALYKQSYPAELREQETRIKKGFAVLNGVGWAANFVGVLTLTGVGALGMGIAAVAGVTAVSLPAGTASSYFYFGAKIEEDNKKESELVDKINTTLQREQNKQAELLEYIYQAYLALQESLSKAAIKLSIPLPENFADRSQSDQLQHLFNVFQENLKKLPNSEVERIVKFADDIRKASTLLRPIKLGNVPIEYSVNGKTENSFNSPHINQAIEQLTANTEILHTVCKDNEAIKSVLQRTKNKATKPTAQPTLLPPEPEGFLVGKLKRLYTVGGGSGIAFGIGTIVCAVALISNPVGWGVGAAILGGIVLSAVILGALSYYVNHRVNKNQEDSLARLEKLDREVEKYQEKQKAGLSLLKTATHSFKEIEKLAKVNELNQDKIDKLAASKESSVQAAQIVELEKKDAANQRLIAELKAQNAAQEFRQSVRDETPQFGSSVPHIPLLSELGFTNEMRKRNLLRRSLPPVPEKKSTSLTPGVKVQ